MIRETGNVKRKVRGQSVVDGAGVRINRIIGSARLSHIDPFVLLDEIRSDNPDEYIAGFPTHPHRGIETITYMIHGNFRHKDSRGGGGLLTDGCVQWMTAGRGILHSEMPEDTDGSLWGYQLWLSLPAKDKMVDARYQHLSPDLVPVVRGDGIEVKIISGRYDDVAGPAENWLKTHYFDVALAPETRFVFEPDEGLNTVIYVHSGSVTVDPGGDRTEVSERELAELDGGAGIEISGGPGGAGFLFLAAPPNNEPIVRGGPFVMNTEEEIEQAFLDYRSGVLR